MGGGALSSALSKEAKRSWGSVVNRVLDLEREDRFRITWSLEPFDVAFPQLSDVTVVVPCARNTALAV